MKISRILIFIALIVSCFYFVDGIAGAAENLPGDPTGDAEHLGHSNVTIDIVWLMNCAAIVFFMKDGVCFF